MKCLEEYRNCVNGYALLRKKINRPMLSMNISITLLYLMVGSGIAPTIGAMWAVVFCVFGISINVACMTRVLLAARRIGRKAGAK